MNDENLKSLPVTVQLEIAKAANDLYMPTKKKSQESDQQSSEGIKEPAASAMRS